MVRLDSANPPPTSSAPRNAQTRGPFASCSLPATMKVAAKQTMAMVYQDVCARFPRTLERQHEHAQARGRCEVGRDPPMIGNHRVMRPPRLARTDCAARAILDPGTFCVKARRRSVILRLRRRHVMRRLVLLLTMACVPLGAQSDLPKDVYPDSRSRLPDQTGEPERTGRSYDAPRVNAASGRPEGRPRFGFTGQASTFGESRASGEAANWRSSRQPAATTNRPVVAP